MFKLPSCTLSAPCFARSHGYCRILRDFDPRWESRGCPFRKEKRDITGLDEQVMRLYQDGLTLMRIGIAIERSEEFVSGVVERLIADGLLTRRSADRYQSRDQMEVAKQLHAQGLNCGEIGRALSIPKTTLQTWARKGLI